MTLITNLIETKLSVAVTVSETGSFFCFYDTATHDSVSPELGQYLHNGSHGVASLVRVTC